MKSSSRSLALYLFSVAALAMVCVAERGNDANRQSKNGKLEGVINEVGMTIEYGRPSVKDRKIWGGLVPWDQVWRTGADEATTVSFDADVTIEGEMLPAGRYALFTIPGMDSWTVIFNNTPDQWGAFSYDPSDDALRVTVPAEEADHEEILTFEVDDDRVVLRWESLAVGFRVRASG